MKRTSKKFSTTLPEPLSSDFISFCVKNGYKYAEAIREGIRRILKPVQYVPQKRILPSIPGAMDMTRENMVNVLVELKGVLVTRKKIVDNYEENLADEVGIK